MQRYCGSTRVVHMQNQTVSRHLQWPVHAITPQFAVQKDHCMKITVLYVQAVKKTISPLTGC